MEGLSVLCSYLVRTDNGNTAGKVSKDSNMSLAICDLDLDLSFDVPGEFVRHLDN